MKITCGMDSKDAEISLDKLEHGIDKAIDFNKIGLKAIGFISERTAKGLDVNESTFKPYSQSYYKEKSGKLGVSAETVNLFDSGNMMAALTMDYDQVSANLFFSDTDNAVKAATHNEGLNGMPQRQFFGLSEGEQESVFKMARDDMKAFMESN